MNERWKNFWIPPWVEANFDKLIVPTPSTQDGEKVFWETEYAISNLQPEAQNLISQAFDTPALAEKISRLTSFLVRCPDQKTIKILRRRFAGALFEIIAFNYLKSKKAPEELVITPRETHEAYMQIFLGREAMDNYGQNSGIEGISIPDGLVFKVNDRQTYLTGICEYSLTLRHKKAQAQAYTSGYVSKDLFPSQLPFHRAYVSAILSRYLKEQPDTGSNISLDYPNFRIIWVLPQSNNSNLQLEDEILFMPFSRREFNEVINGLFKDLS